MIIAEGRMFANICLPVCLRLIWSNSGAASMAFIRNLQREGWHWWIKWCNHEVSLQPYKSPRISDISHSIDSVAASPHGSEAICRLT